MRSVEPIDDILACECYGLSPVALRVKHDVTQHGVNGGVEPAGVRVSLACVLRDGAFRLFGDAQGYIVGSFQKFSVP